MTQGTTQQRTKGTARGRTQPQASNPWARVCTAGLAGALCCCALSCSDDGPITYSATDGVAGAVAPNRTVTPLLPGAAGSDGAAGTPGVNAGGTAGVPGTGGFGGIGGALNTGGVAGTIAGTDGLGDIDLTDNFAGTSGSAGAGGSPDLGAAGSNVLP